MTATVVGACLVAGALVAGGLSARSLSREGRGTPASRSLLLVGLALWIAAAYLLPPVALISDLGISDWLAIPLRLVAAYFVGMLLSRLWYAIVP